MRKNHIEFDFPKDIEILEECLSLQDIREKIKSLQKCVSLMFGLKYTFHR